MNIISKISQVISLKGFAYSIWDGYNNSTYITSNRLIQEFKELKRDAYLNTSTLKQISKYDRKMFHHLIGNGVMVEYETFLITMIKKGNMVKIDAYNVNTKIHHMMNMSKTSLINLMDMEINSDLHKALNNLRKYWDGQGVI